MPESSGVVFPVFCGSIHNGHQQLTWILKNYNYLLNSFWLSNLGLVEHRKYNIVHLKNYLKTQFPVFGLCQLEWPHHLPHRYTTIRWPKVWEFVVFLMMMYVYSNGNWKPNLLELQAILLLTYYLHPVVRGLNVSGFMVLHYSFCALRYISITDRAQNPGSHVSTVPHMWRCSRYSMSRFQRTVVRSLL
jgi:hypothetical protein